MNRISTDSAKRILSVFSATGIHNLFQQVDGALGAIFTLHHVKPDAVPEFSPNAHLTITPDFLEQIIVLLKARGFEFISMNDARDRIATSDPSYRFAALTFDDGYKDNLANAVPILKTHDVPYTIYIASGLIDGSATLWWEDVECLVRSNSSIEYLWNGESFSHPCGTIDEKQTAFRKIVDHIITNVPELEIQNWVSDLSQKYAFDADAHREREMATWDELSNALNAPLCSMGAHTKDHPLLGRLSDVECKAAIEHGVNRHIEMLGQQPDHFAYPFGYPDAAGKREFLMTKEIGFETAVTTRPGMIYKAHQNHLTALPRLSINGLYQDKKYFAPLTSGLPSRLLNKMQKLNVS